MTRSLWVRKEGSLIRPSTSSELGLAGERAAARFLEQHGYRLIVSNFKVPVGRNRRGAQITGEIDIVAVNEETLCFVEVKTRRSDEFAAPTANVDRRKQRQIIRTARVYRRIFNVWEAAHRYDVVSIVMPSDGEPRIELLKGFWSEENFRKRRWNLEMWEEHLS